MGSNFLSASANRVEMSSGRILCVERWPPWVVGMAAGDAVYLAIKKSISCW